MDASGRLHVDKGRTSYVEEAPHVHVHYMQDDAAMESGGYADLEVCCHGCGTGVVYRYSVAAVERFERDVRAGLADPGRGHPKIREVRDAFLERHRGCLSGNASTAHVVACPSERRLMNFVDLRLEGL